MASTYAIDEPRTLASLPRPFNQDVGTTRPGLVHGFSGSRKRKRNEIVAGIDGEGINIYTVQSSKLLTSHSLPPYTLLTCSPSCAYLKGSQSRPARRFTYAAIRTDHGLPAHKLLCLTESLSEDETAEGAGDTSVQKAERESGSSEDPVVFIENIQDRRTFGTESIPDLLVVSKGGDLQLLDGQLKQQLASFSLSDNNTKAQLSVEHVTLQSVTAARKGLLKERPDLVASAGPTTETPENGKDDSELIVVITRPTSKKRIESGGYTLHLLIVRHQNSGSTSGAAFRVLDQWPIPSRRPMVDEGEATSQFCLDSASGFLYELFSETLAVYELSITPRAVNQFQLPKKGGFEMRCMTRSSILLTSQDQCYVYDTKFGSLQAALGFSGTSAARNKGKRKRSARDAPGPHVRLFGWYSKLQTAVALMGTDLIVFKISTSRKRHRIEETLLIDSMGSSHPSLNAPRTDQKRAGNLERLDSLLNIRNVNDFERVFFQLVQQIDVTNPFKPHHDQAVAIKALAAIFDWNNTKTAAQKSCSVKINGSSWSQKVLAWIIANGHLTPSNINKALHGNKPPSVGYLPTVTAADMISALATYDVSLRLVARLVASPRLSLEGWVQSLRHLITSYQTPATPKRDQLMISNGYEPSHAPRMNGEVSEEAREGTETNDVDSTEAAETSLAQSEISLSLSLLEPSHAQLRTEALRACLSQLSLCFAPNILVSAFRSQLSRRDLVLLIDLLRIELSSSGWTSHRLDYHPGREGAFDQADEAIHVIANLLNICVDALGVGGWLSMSLSASFDELSSDEMDTTSDGGAGGGDIIATLRDATNNTLEAAQESAFFANFLTDFLRYDAALQRAQRGEHGHQKGKLGPGNRRVGGGGGEMDEMRRSYTHHDGAATITRPSQPTSAVAGTGKEGNGLPLGAAKSVEAVSKTRIDAGGEVRARSARDIARKMSRRAGAYEFESLDF